MYLPLLRASLPRRALVAAGCIALAVKTGTSATDYAKEHFKGTELRLFPNSDNAYLEVATGRADAAMHLSLIHI